MIMTAMNDIKTDFSTLLQDFKSLPNHLKIVGILYFLVCPLIVAQKHIAGLLFPLLTMFFIFIVLNKKNSFYQIFIVSFKKNKSALFIILMIFFIWCGLSSFWITDPSAILKKYPQTFIYPLLFFSFYQSQKHILNAKYKNILISFLCLGVIIASITVSLDFYAFDGKIAFTFKHMFSKNFEEHDASMPFHYQKIILILGSLSGFILFTSLSKTFKIISSICSIWAFSTLLSDTAIVSYILFLLAYFVLNSKNINFSYVKWFLIFSYSIVFLFLPIILKFALESGFFQHLLDAEIIKEGSYCQRIEIFECVIKSIYERFYIGHGILWNNPDFIKIGFHMPHNFVLHIWRDLGAIGAFLSLFLINGFIFKTFQNLKKYRKTLIFLISVQVHIFFGIGFWEHWWWSFAFLIFPLLIDNEEVKF